MCLHVRLIVCALSVASALCLTLRGEVAAQPASPSPHAWFVIEPEPVPSEQGGEAPEPSEAGILVHVPPRIPVGAAAPSPDLRVSRIVRLDGVPEHLIAVGDSVYAMTRGDDPGQTRVGRSRAVARGVRDLWGHQPLRRLEVLPAIEGDVVAATSDGSTPIVLVRGDDGLTLLRFAANAWAPFATRLPDDVADPLGLAWRDGAPAVLDSASGALRWWQLDDGRWVGDAVPGSDGAAWRDTRIIGDWFGEWIALQPATPLTSDVLAIGPTGAVRLGEIAARFDAPAAVQADPGRLIVAASASSEADEPVASTLPSPGIAQRAVSVVEFSLVTGELLASGRASAASPVSRNEFQSLAILLFACMILVLLVVVRPSPAAAEPVLPPGTAIATPGRRVLATFVDFIPAVWVTSRLLDMSIAETLGPIALPLTGSVDIVPLVMSLAVAAAHSSVGEMLAGRSLGKLAAGLFVARVDPLPGSAPEPGVFRTPTPAAAILRNLLKWFLFPATAIVLSDPAGRHRGDLMARSAVLMPVAGGSEAG
ncbi:MAG: hypothetical protein AAFR96_02220 [Planctomycetota bacterium]